MWQRRPDGSWFVTSEYPTVKPAGQAAAAPTNTASIVLAGLAFAGLIAFYYLSKPEELTPAQRREREEEFRRQAYRDYQRDLAAARARARR